MQPWLSPFTPAETSPLIYLACTSRALPAAHHDPEFLEQVRQRPVPQLLGKLHTFTCLTRLRHNARRTDSRRRMPHVAGVAYRNDLSRGVVHALYFLYFHASLLPRAPAASTDRASAEMVLDSGFAPRLKRPVQSRRPLDPRLPGALVSPEYQEAMRAFPVR